MNRNVVLFCCFCLGASVLVLHFRPRTTKSVAVSNPATTAPIGYIFPASDEPPVIASVLPKPIMPIAQAAEASSAVTQTMAVPVDVPVMKQKAAVQDKYAALRELSALAAQDPAAALAAALKLPAGDERNEALTAVCSGIAQTDPADAVKLAQELQLDKQPGAVMEDLVQQWAGNDLVSSLAWVENQPTSGQRDELTTRVAYVMSRNEPSDAAELVMSRIPPGPAQDEAIMTVLHQWANQNFVAAANWAKDTIAGPLQGRALNELKGILDYQNALAQR
jgi:hypothetical protein